MFINFSNHPSEKWDKKQLAEAEKYGTVVDVPFPKVSAEGDEGYIDSLADEYVKKILEADSFPAAVLVQGEFNLTFVVVNRLLNKHIKVLAACTDRNVTERENSSGEFIKESGFTFSRFREYRF